MFIAFWGLGSAISCSTAILWDKAFRNQQVEQSKESMRTFSNIRRSNLKLQISI